MAAARKAKKTATTKSSLGKPSSKRKKASRATKASKPAAKKKTTAGRKSKAERNSVDSILTQFAKRRTEHQTKLTTVRKKIAQLEAKTKAYQAEIVSLKEAESSTETSLGQLDQQRDQAVRDMLEKLGVKLVGETGVESSSKPELAQTEPLFDTVFNSPSNSNGTQELAPSSSSDELLDNEQLGDDHS
jgi:chromosome segregation ATPase